MLFIDLTVNQLTYSLHNHTEMTLAALNSNITSSAITQWHDILFCPHSYTTPIILSLSAPHPSINVSIPTPFLLSLSPPRQAQVYVRVFYRQIVIGALIQLRQVNTFLLHHHYCGILSSVITVPMVLLYNSYLTRGITIYISPFLR